MSFLAFQPQILVPLTFNVSLLSTFLFPTRISSSSYKLEMIPSIVYASWAGSALLTYRSFALLKMLSWEVLLGYHEGYGTNTWWGCRRKKKLSFTFEKLYWMKTVNFALSFAMVYLVSETPMAYYVFWFLNLLYYVVFCLTWQGHVGKKNSSVFFLKPPRSNLLVGQFSLACWAMAV